jgi:hypothetical protein
LGEGGIPFCRFVFQANPRQPSAATPFEKWASPRFACTILEKEVMGADREQLCITYAWMGGDNIKCCLKLVDKLFLDRYEVWILMKFCLFFIHFF